MAAGLSTFLVAVAQVVGTLIAVLIVERFGRKILLVISDFCMSISIFTLGAYFYLEEHPNKFAPQTVEDLGWLPLVSLIIYIFTFSIGKLYIKKNTIAQMYIASSKIAHFVFAFLTLPYRFWAPALGHKCRNSPSRIKGLWLRHCLQL